MIKTDEKNLEFQNPTKQKTWLNAYLAFSETCWPNYYAKRAPDNFQESAKTLKSQSSRELISVVRPCKVLS